MKACLAIVPVIFISLWAQAAPQVIKLGGRAALSADRAAAVAVTESALRAPVRFLSDDLLGGRAPGSPGDALSRLYLASQFEELGLLPAGEVQDGRATYFQWVQLVGVTSHLAAPPDFHTTATTLPVRISLPPADLVLVAGAEAAQSQLQDAELVFVGYGITAPEYQWDDYKGVDLRGKVLLMMNNDPEDDPQLFAGKTRLYYGRWDYKYAEAARHGAAGALIIHTTHSAGYPWSVVRASWDGENFSAPEQAGDKSPHLQVRGWLTEDASRRVVQAGGHDLDALRRAAEVRDFRPVPLGVRVSVRLKNTLRRLQSANVLAYLPGSDARLAGEAVAVTAHFDHLGTKPDAKGTDKIYNGALDNASGVAGLLAIARAAVLGPVTRRPLVFSSVTGEEDGLIGSEYLVAHPPVLGGGAPVAFIADINLDGLNVFGKSPQVVQLGRGKSTLDAVVDALAAGQGRKVLPDPLPDRGSFYRSDQFSFARAGVPSIYLGDPVDLYGPGNKVQAGAGLKQVLKYIEENYHQPTDELRPEWDLAGAVQDVQLLYLATLRVANAPGRPHFYPKDEFGKVSSR